MLCIVCLENITKIRLTKIPDVVFDNSMIYFFWCMFSYELELPFVGTLHPSVFEHKTIGWILERLQVLIVEGKACHVVEGM